MGYSLDVGVDFLEFGTLTLGPGEEGVWWFAWGFDAGRWARMWAFPETPFSRLDVVAEWSTLDEVNPPVSPNDPEPRRDPYQLWVHWRNPGRETIAFRPTVVVVPRRIPF